MRMVLCMSCASVQSTNLTLHACAQVHGAWSLAKGRMIEEEHFSHPLVAVQSPCMHSSI